MEEGKREDNSDKKRSLKDAQIEESAEAKALREKQEKDQKK